MPWFRSPVAWGAGLVALFALLRGLRGLLGPDDRPLALGVAITVVLVAALVPPVLGRDRGRVTPPEQGARKAVQFFGAAGVLLLVVLLGGGVMVAGGLGLVVAALVPLVRPTSRGRVGG